MIDEITKSFVSKFNDFLKQQIDEHSLSSDGVESLEVAIQCLEAAFEINVDDANQSNNVGGSSESNSENSNKINPINLFDIYKTAYLSTSTERKELAEVIKNDGNRLMKEGKFEEALLEYNRAITYDPKNPVFYCNRAAAFIRLSLFEKAIGDCKMALVYNPSYGKAYGRMGIAYSSLNKFEDAKAAYQKALEMEPNNQDYLNNLRMAEERITSSTNNANPAANSSISDTIQTLLSSVNLQNLQQPNLSNLSGPGMAIPPNFENIFNSSNMGNIFGEMLNEPAFTSALQSLAENPNIMRDVQETLMNVMRRQNSNTDSNSGNQNDNSSNRNNQ